MFSISTWAALLLLATVLLNVALPLAQNVRIAQASGIPYVCVPYYAYNRLTSMFMGRTFLRLADKVAPGLSATSWRHLVKSNWPWKFKHAPFTALQTDTFLTVSPGGIIMHTADANVIAQIIARGEDFPKATQLYRHVDIYGKNVVSSGGATWRRHRAVTSPAFTEKNNQLVWKETLDVTQAVLASWTRGNSVVHQLAGDSMRLSLEVIGRAGLGQKLEWPKATESADKELPPGHTMSFTVSVQFLLANMLYVMALPMWFLRKSPFKKLNKSYKAYVEWGQYMKEMIASKKIDLQSSPRESMDLIGQLLKSQQGNYGKSLRSAGLTDSEVMGNLFMFIIAGHETSANSIHFSLLFLALHPEAQRKVQQDLEEIFQGRSMSEWEYERDVPALLNGYLAAVLNEELRLIAPTITIPKVSSPEPQSLMVNGEDVTVPPNTMVRLCVPAVHRNPKFWPHGPPKDADKPYFPLDNLDNDLEEFKPDRWLPNKPGGPLYMPVRGSYLPFSDGQRACLGKRFAQVEILAALAVIFSEYSIELAVDEWATDDEVKSMTMEERRVTWKKAEEKGHWILQNKMVGIITLQLRGGHVPVRFVKKGEERFADI